MRAAVYYSNNDIRIEELPVPKIRGGEMLVKVIASGICGSDVMEWYRKPKAPLVLGHEIAGEVFEVADGVSRFKVGDRVFVSHHVPCNTCRYCLSGNHTVCDTLRTTNFDPGGFAEYLRVPKINMDSGVFILPDGMSFDDGAFIEPLACVVRGQRLADLRPGRSVLVLGSGISGILHIALARASGADKIVATDVSKYRLDAARRFGADETIHGEDDVPKILLKVNDGRLADIVIVATGAKSAFSRALKSVDRGGTILLFAPTEPSVELPLPLYDLWRDGIKMIPSYGAAPKDIEEAIELIGSGKIPVRDMITHRLPLVETGRGFQIAHAGDKSIKVIIEPQR